MERFHMAASERYVNGLNKACVANLKLVGLPSTDYL